MKLLKFIFISMDDPGRGRHLQRSADGRIARIGRLDVPFDQRHSVTGRRQNALPPTAAAAAAAAAANQRYPDAARCRPHGPNGPVSARSGVVIARSVAASVAVPVRVQQQSRRRIQSGRFLRASAQSLALGGRRNWRYGWSRR